MRRPAPASFLHAATLGLLFGACSTDPAKEPVSGEDTAPGTDGADGSGADPTTLRYYGDIQPIMARSCVGCHAEGGVGGFSLQTYAEVSAWAGPIARSVETRTMPPWTAAKDCSNYQGDFSLSEEEVAQIVEWADGGAPEGDPANMGELPPAFEPTTLDRVDMEIEVPFDYAPVNTPDDYRCFLVEWPYEEQVWVTGYHIQPQNLTIAHHVIPFLIDPESVPAMQALDDADPSPGYPCYGGPGGDIDTLQRMRWLGSWAPGSGAQILPEGTGIRVQPGSMVALQMHYYNPANLPDTDRTKVALKVETEPQGWADIQPWTDVAWVLGVGMDIPANTEGVTHEFRYTATPGDTFTIHTAGLHMHTLGRSAKMWVEHADGTESCLLHEDSWDFNWQRGYALTEPVSVSAGDTVVLQCTWDNTTDADAAWGEGTGDEMCLGITTLTQ